jgi:hypothetical protein
MREALDLSKELDLIHIVSKFAGYLGQRSDMMLKYIEIRDKQAQNKPPKAKTIADLRKDAYLDELRKLPTLFFRGSLEIEELKTPQPTTPPKPNENNTDACI